MGLRDIALLAILVGLIPISALKPWIGVLVWTWIGLMNPHRLTWSLEQLPIAMLVAAALLGGLLLTSDRRAPPWTREMVLLGTLAVYFTITTVFSWYPAYSWPEWEKISKILLFIFVTTMLIWGRNRIRLLMLVMVLSLGFYGLKGGIFSILTGGEYRIWGPEGSFIGGNTTIGLALCMCLPLALLLAKEEKSRWIRWLLIAIFVASIPAILFTYSRGAFVGLVSLVPFLAWRYKRRAILLSPLLGLILLVGYQFLPDKWVTRQATIENYEQDHSAMQRIQAWGVAFNVALDRPLLGAGYDFEEAGDTQRWLSYANFVEPWASEERAAHSIYFQVMGEHGMLAFALYAALLAGTMLRLGRLARLERDPDLSWVGTYARAAQLSLIPFLVAGAFLNLAYFDLFFLMVALSAVLEREYREGARPAGINEGRGDRNATTQAAGRGGPPGGRSVYASVAEREAGP